jgi:hypothetical protein
MLSRPLARPCTNKLISLPKPPAPESIIKIRSELSHGLGGRVARAP